VENCIAVLYLIRDVESELILVSMQSVTGNLVPREVSFH